MHIKRLQVQVYIPFITKDIAIIRILVNAGGHLEFSHEKVDEKNGNIFFSVLLESEKSQLLKIYMKKSHNDTMPYTIYRPPSMSSALC